MEMFRWFSYTWIKGFKYMIVEGVREGWVGNVLRSVHGCVCVCVCLLEFAWIG